MNNIYDDKQLQERNQSAPTALPTSGIADPDVSFDTKLNCHVRVGNTGYSTRPNVGKHTIFVLNVNGKPLTPTTPAKARKLLKGGKAKKYWSKFNTFGIQLVDKTREEIQKTVLGYDPGSKFEGVSVVCGDENNLSVKLNLPNKTNIVNKLKERRQIRRNRRYRKCRRRKARFSNRKRNGFIAPSQLVIVNSRLKILKEFCNIYPICNVAMENIKFNHLKYRWGKNFSTMEIGKQKIRIFFKNRNIEIFEYDGFKTSKIRKKYGYKKTFIKSADHFTSHCSDSLSLAIEISCKKRIHEGLFLIVDDTYRCVKRKLHDRQPSIGGIREKYSHGNVNGVKKSIIIGAKNGNIGQLCGETNGRFRYYDLDGKRKITKTISWINNQFKTNTIKEEQFYAA